ncbi:MAG: hypothetical protein SFY70_03780 [Bacteroidia bacterium]|nr:hypothetical protein [Bacteroidia bacterium]
MAYLLALRYERRFRGVLLSWRMPKLVFTTVVVFVVNLALFTLACLFFATYFGRLHGWELLRLRSDALFLLGTTALLLLAGVLLGYLALQRIYTQRILEEGILLELPTRSWGHRLRLLRWDDILDFYLQSDYPVTVYRFLLRGQTGQYQRHELRVPFYVVHRFEALLEQKLRRAKERRNQAVASVRKLPGS